MEMLAGPALCSEKCNQLQLIMVKKKLPLTYDTVLPNGLVNPCRMQTVFHFVMINIFIVLMLTGWAVNK